MPKYKTILYLFTGFLFSGCLINDGELPNHEIDGVYPLSAFTIIDEDNYEGNSIQATSEGSFLIGGADKFQRAKLIHVDQENTITWQQFYDEHYTNSVKCVKELEGAGYIAVGNSLGSSRRKAFAFISDKKGEAAYFKKYGADTSNTRVNDIIQSSADEFLMVGHTSTSFFYNTELYIIKTNENGDTLWTKTISRGRDAEYHSILKTTSDDFIMLGSNDTSFFIDKMNEDGELLSIRSFETEFTSPLNGKKMIQTKDGNLLLAITHSKEAWGTDSYIQVIKLNQDGEDIWSSIYSMDKDFTCNSIVETNDNSFVLVGSTSSYGNGFIDVLVLKIDAYGNEIWTKAYGGRAYDAAADVALKEDGGYLITGATKEDVDTGNDFFLFVLNIDRNGFPVF